VTTEFSNFRSFTLVAATHICSTPWRLVTVLTTDCYRHTHTRDGDDDDDDDDDGGDNDYQSVLLAAIDLLVFDIIHRTIKVAQ